MSDYTFHGKACASYNEVIKKLFYKLGCQFSSIKHASAAVAETVVLAHSYDVTHGVTLPYWLVVDACEKLSTRVISSAMRRLENGFFQSRAFTRLRH